MATKFKVGDTVVCTNDDFLRISDGLSIAIGEEYKVLGITEILGNVQTHQRQVDEGHGWGSSKFELASSKTVLDITKPVQTADGRPVTILTTEGRGDYPIIGYIGDNENYSTWTTAGEYCISSTSTNLVNVVEKHTVWLNVYKDFNAVHGTYQSAYNASQTLGKPDKQLLARKRVEVVVGEFDNEGTV